MKKNIALLLALFMLLAITACSRNEEEPATQESTETNATSSPTGITQDDTQGATESTTTESDPTEATSSATEPSATEPPTTNPSNTLSTEPPATQPQATEAPHTHNYTIKTTTDATCTEKGYTIYTCSCGETYTADEIAPKGHSYTKEITAPTCTEKGYIHL